MTCWQAIADVAKLLIRKGRYVEAVTIIVVLELAGPLSALIAGLLVISNHR